MNLKILQFLAVFVLVASCGKTSNEPIQTCERQIEIVRSQFVQDKRTALFDVKAYESGAGIVLKGETIFPEAKTVLFEKLGNSSANFIDSIIALPTDELAGQHFGIVGISVCNIRSSPKHSAELATQALLGTPLRVYKKQGDFYFVQTPDNYLGWLDDGGFALFDKKGYDEWMDSNRAVCIADYTYAFQFPDETAGKVTDLIAGNVVKSMEQQASFMKIQLPDGRTGFVKTEQFLPYSDWIASRQATALNIIHTAQEFMGRPYLWGGTSGKGMDCSGFTKTVFYLNGIQLERDASLQVHTGQAIETDTTLKNLIPGDLLFFGNLREDGSERITHVAIYMGDGKIIHASDRVKIESLIRGEANFAEQRLQTLRRAKRIIGSEGKNGIIELKDSPFYAIQKLSPIH